MTNANIPLKRWIQHAVQASSSSGLSAYLTSSLRIAISLSDQICDAEELSDIGLSSGLDSLPPPFPISCVDWADCVTVSLKSSDEVNECELLQPLPFANGSGEVPFEENGKEFNELLNIIARDADAEALSNSDQYFVAGPMQGSSGAATENSNYNEHINYLNVDCAQISSSGNSQSINNGTDPIQTKREKQQRIYSLGLALYELFSGGDLPPPELLVVSSPDGGSLTAISSSNVEEEGFGAISNGHISGLDFASAVNLSDIGSFNHDGAQYDSVCNKRQSTYTGESASSTGTKRRGSQVLRNVSVEHLRMKGVPGPVCDLIRSMLDSVNGDFMADESYKEISDVISDLKMMLEKPSTYLYDLDVNRLAQTGLELDETLICRDKEFASLQCAYMRSLAGSPSVAIITGSSGTGKSTLAYRFGAYVCANGGLFLYDKFDQMKQVNPFSTVASAFNSYVGLLAQGDQAERAVELVSKLKLVLGSDLYYLEQVIPNLRLRLKENSSTVSPDHDCVNGIERLHYLFCQFVETILSCAIGPLVMFLDDLQWSDSASISILGKLLTSLRSMEKGNLLFFMGSCRSDEMSVDHPFWDMLNSIGSFGFETPLVKLNCMDKETVNHVVSNLLHLPPRLVRSLSDIVYQKTKGNALFFTRMLLSLNKEGLLRISLSRRRWEWDDSVIQASQLPDDVAEFFVQRINSLPIDTKSAIACLACFGSSVDCEVIQFLETSLDFKLQEPLNIAIAEGLVSKIDGRFRWCHDRIQSSAYNMIDAQDRRLHHLNYGMALMEQSLRSNNSWIFVAVAQINLATPSAVQDKRYFSMIARYNLIAGKSAMEMSEFSSALNFFDHGISFLRKKHWQEQYELSLELYNLAAKCALTVKDLNSATMFCDQVSMKALTFEDTLDTAFISMTALTHGKVSQSVDFGLGILAQLGVDIPNSHSETKTLQLISQTQSMLEKISDETILSYHRMSDDKKVMVMKFLAKLENPLQQVKPAMQPIITIKILRYTIEHGITPASAIGFAYFGGVVANLGDLCGGNRFTKIALALLNKFDSTDVAGEVVWAASEVLTFLEPMLAVNEYRIQGEKNALAAGDVHWACINNLLCSVCLFWSGAKLSVAKQTFATACRFAEGHEHLTSLYYLRTYEQTVSTLTGNANETLNDEQLTRNVIENKNPLQLVIVYFHKMFLALIFNKLDDMKESAEKFTELSNLQPTFLLHSYTIQQTFILGLVSFRVFRKTRNKLWMDKAKSCREKVQLWREKGCAWNFEHLLFMLEAEEYYSLGDLENAHASYDLSISSTRTHKYLNDEALANELAANFFLSTGNTTLALQYFTNAHEKYNSWGANAKANELFMFVQETFGNLPEAEATKSASSNGVQVVDLNERTRKRCQF